MFIDEEKIRKNAKAKGFFGIKGCSKTTVKFPKFDTRASRRGKRGYEAAQTIIGISIFIAMAVASLALLFTLAKEANTYIERQSKPAPAIKMQRAEAIYTPKNMRAVSDGKSGHKLVPANN